MKNSQVLIRPFGFVDLEQVLDRDHYFDYMEGLFRKVIDLYFLIFHESPPFVQLSDLLPLLCCFL